MMYLVLEQNGEADGEGNDEEEEDSKEANESLEDLYDHDDVDADAR